MFQFRSLILLCSCGLMMLVACGENSDHKTKQTDQRGPDTQQVQMTEQTLLQASLAGKIEFVQRTIEHGINIDTKDRSGRTPLMLASYNGHSKVVHYLLKQDANPSATDNQGRTPLIFAASGPNPGTVKILLDNGANPNVTDKQEGWTALMWAASEGNMQVVQVLLDHGADPTMEDNDQETARDFAVNNGHNKVAELLREAEDQK